MAVHTISDLRQMQSLPLQAKITMTMNRIRQFMDVYDSYISFSGGKDSTVLLHIARQIYPDIPAVYIDTGLEYPEIREFVKTIPNVTWLHPVKWDKHKRQYDRTNFREVIKTYGYPMISKEVARDIYVARKCPNGKTADKFNPDGEHALKYGMRFCRQRWEFLKDSDIPISNMCCDILKKNPAKQFEKKSGLKPITATMACESALRETAWLNNGCNAFEAKRPTSAPMSFWTEQDVLQYLQEYDVPYSSAYGEIVNENGKLCTTGCKRTGCVFCMFGCHLEKEPNKFQQLKITHPNLWEYCMRPWDRGGLGMKDVLDFIGVKTE